MPAPEIINSDAGSGKKLVRDNWEDTVAATPMHLKIRYLIIVYMATYHICINEALGKTISNFIFKANKKTYNTKKKLYK